MPDRISRSPLWKLQDEFYQGLGIEAWSNKTPFYVTNSTMIAEAYADLIIALCLDHPMQASEPVYIIELGTGTGRMSFYLQRELGRKKGYFQATRDLKFQLVLTDIAASNLEFWQKHEGLKGMDFAIFRPETEHEIHLKRAGHKLETGKNPVIVLANYVFDSIKHDEFAIYDGTVEECLIDVKPTSKTPNDIRDYEVKRTYRKIDPGKYYKEPALTRLLTDYAAEVKRGAVTIPVGSLAALENLRKLGQKLVLISSDRAFTTLAAMARYTEHPHDVHEGAFSHIVNYDGIGRQFPRYLHTTHNYLNSVQTVCCLDWEQETPHLDYAFKERVDRANLINSANEMFALVRERPNAWRSSLPAFVRLNLYDPQALAAVAQRLYANLSQLNLAERDDVLEILDNVWENDYHFPGGANTTFWLGHLYYGVGRYDDAIYYLQETARRGGDDEVLAYLRGLCHEAAGRLPQARDLYARALEIKPDFEDARKQLMALMS